MAKSLELIRAKIAELEAKVADLRIAERESGTRAGTSEEVNKTAASETETNGKGGLTGLPDH